MELIHKGYFSAVLTSVVNAGVKHYILEESINSAMPADFFLDVMGFYHIQSLPSSFLEIEDGPSTEGYTPGRVFSGEKQTHPAWGVLERVVW